MHKQNGAFKILVHPPGIEPGRTCVRGILSPLRLPIPPWMRRCVGVVGGSGEIRTHGWVTPSLVFKTSPFNHSGTLPYNDVPQKHNFLARL